MKKVNQNKLARAVCLAQGIGKPRQVDIARMKESLRLAFIEMTGQCDAAAVVKWVASDRKTGRAEIGVWHLPPSVCTINLFMFKPSLRSPKPRSRRKIGAKR